MCLRLYKGSVFLPKNPSVWPKKVTNGSIFGPDLFIFQAKIAYMSIMGINCESVI